MTSLLVAVAGFVVWWMLPAIAEFVLIDAAESAGFESASLKLDRIGLDGVRASEAVLRGEGFDVSFSSAAVTYSPAKVLTGSIGVLQINGLEISLDFTKPRNGLFPEGLAKLISSFGGGEGGFQFPIGRIEVLEAKTVVILPEETHLFAVDLTSEMRPDGRVAFGIKSEHPDQRLLVEGVANTETLDADVRVAAVETRPELYLSIARQLGLFEMADNVDFDSGSIEAEGSISIENGEIASVLGSLQLAEMSAEFDGTSVVLSEVRVESGRDSDGVVAGTVRAQLLVSSGEADWNLEPMTIEAALSEDAITGAVEGIGFTHSGTNVDGMAVRFEVTEPWSRESLHINAEAAIAAASFGGVQVSPFTAILEGDFEEIVLGIVEMKFAREWPVSLSNCSATVTSPFGPEVGIEGGATLELQSLTEESASTAGWSWKGSGQEQPVLRTRFVGRLIEGQIEGVFNWLSESPKLDLRHGAETISLSPTFAGEVTFDFDGVSAESTLDLRDIRQDGIADLFHMDEARLTWQLPHTSYESLAGIVNRSCQGLPFSSSVALEVDYGEVAKRFSLQVQRSVETDSWNGVLRVDVNEESIMVDDVSLSGVKFQKMVRSEGTSDEQLFRWIYSEDKIEALSELAAGATAEVSFSAKSVMAPGDLRIEWLAGSVLKSTSLADRDRWGASLVFDCGSVRVGGERIERVHGDLRLVNGISSLDLVGRLNAVFEGSPLAVDIAQQVFVDWKAKSFSVGGVFSLPEFVVANSDWIGRHFSEFAGLIVGATVSGHGNLHFDSKGDWDADLYVSIVDGTATDPVRKATISGFEADLSFSSLRELRTLPGQTVRFKDLSFGNFSISDGAATFRLNGADQILVEGIGVNVFGGVVSTGSFSLFLPDPDVAVSVVVKAIDISQVVQHFDLFDGEMTGRLRGHVPIALLAGKPVFGEGFLRLDDEYPSKLVYRTRGVFTRGLPSGNSFRDQVNRLGYELLEEGLESVDVESVEVRLFHREFPGTPIRIVVIGSSKTDRATVPFVLENNINGSVAEVLDFLYRLFVM